MCVQIIKNNEKILLVFLGFLLLWTRLTKYIVQFTNKVITLGWKHCQIQGP
jgi:hypothetical protein